MLSYKITGLNETLTSLSRTQNLIRKGKQTAQTQAATFGLNMAQRKVPVDTGETRDNIKVTINSYEESIITSIPAPSDMREHRMEFNDGFSEFLDDARPVNVLLDEGRVNELNWGKRRTPKRGQFGFMKTTVEPTREEFIRLLNVEIQEATK